MRKPFGPIQIGLSPNMLPIGTNTPSRGIGAEKGYGNEGRHRVLSWMVDRGTADPPL